jgi:type I restriction enzyme, R subunit
MSDDFDFNELTQSEEPADVLLRALKYDFVEAAALDAERESPADPLLTRRLEAALRRLNRWLSDDNLRKAVRAIRQVQAAGLIEANEKVHIALTHGVAVEQDLGSGKLGQTVHYFDYDNPENNEFLFTRQYRVAGPRVEIVADVVAFVNGIPVVVVECKSPGLEDPIGEAVLRLLRYQELTEEYRTRGAPRLFHTAQILIAACGQAAKFGTVGTQAEAYAPWKVPYPMTLDQLQSLVGRVPTPQDVLLAGLLQKANLLELLRNFIVFETSQGRTIRKLARYPQFVAANEAVKRVRTAKRPDRRGGIIWHTQGSGKSLTMLFTSVKLRRLREAENPTLVIVTDRTDLDDQITGTFQRCGFPNPEQAKSVKHLREVLARGSGQTVMTTVQKFQEATSDLHPVLNTGENVFVFVDEAHRTQYKFLAANMRQALPRACFIGFTGTPIDKRDRSTFATFGPYIHTYTIEQSVADGATVPIYYEMRQSQDRVEGEDLDAAFDRVFGHLSEEERSRIRKKYGTRELIAGAPHRIERICRDLLDHYRSAIKPNGFKAQVVACSREAAATYKETLDRLGAPESAIIMSFTNDDPEHIARWEKSKAEQRKLIERFKDKDDPLGILVVCDMLLTGFDAPVEQVMYLDASLKEHNLLQAIARVNRPAKGKDYGLVVDYWGVGADLTQALAIFSPTDIEGALRPKLEELPRLESRHRTALRFFARIDRRDVEACVRALEAEDVRAEFDLAFKRFTESLDMLLPDPAALPYVSDLRWLGKVRHAARNRFRDDRLNLAGCRAKVRALIEEHIRSDGVEQLLEPMSILAPEFEARVAALQSEEAQASEMEHAIRYEIHVRLDENPVFYGSLRERLEEIIENRRLARIDTAAQLRGYREITQEIRNVHWAAEQAGLDDTGFAIYELLGAAQTAGSASPAGEPSASNGPVDTGRRAVALGILEDLRELAVVDWTHKEDVQRRMRQAIKSQLRGAGHAREQVEALTSQLMDLARVRLG